MAMSNVGLQRIRGLVATDVTLGELGTDSTAPTTSDTDLNTAVIATNSSTTITESDKQFTVEYSLDSTTGTGNTYREYKNENASGTMYDRIVFTGIAHSSSTEIHLKQKFFFKGV